MALTALELRKFEFDSEPEAAQICTALNKGKYTAIALGSAVVSQCRNTKKLGKILNKHPYTEVILSEYDKDKILSII